MSARLTKWIREEIDFVETHERERPRSKFAFNWNVETTSFFFKLLYDQNVLGKVTLEKLSEQIVTNCSSVAREELTAGSVISKFYTKDAEVVASLEKLLSEMLADVRQFMG